VVGWRPGWWGGVLRAGCSVRGVLASVGPVRWGELGGWVGAGDGVGEGAREGVGPICQRGRETLKLRNSDAGWSSSVARWAHNPEVAGSNPAPATK
jgi:hypothetical protein